MTHDRRPPGAARPRFLAALFDFGGTLDADGEPAVDQFFHAYRTAGGGRTDAEFDAIFRESDRRLAADPRIATAGFRDTVEIQSRVIAHLVRESEHIDPLSIAQTVYGRVVPIATRNAGILGALQTLGVRTGVISNFTGNLQQCLAELGLAAVIEVVIDSALVGTRKPEPRIFQLALDRLGVVAGDALMVGDNPFADIEAAAALGLATCWLAPMSRPVPEGRTPTFRIESLSALLECFDAERGTRDAERATCTA